MTRPPSTSAQGIVLVNCRSGCGSISSLRVVGSRIAALNVDPQQSDLIIDLQGDRILPGLINAHDHLQLNSLPRIRSFKQYRHVRDWILEIDANRRSDPEFDTSISVARNDRLLIGGIKNLLSGVTIVAHHDPLYPFLSKAGFPTRVVANYGWSHSLYVDGEEKVGNSYRNTPSEWPWIIHVAEGVGEDAAGEFERVDALGCLGANTLLVHGIALDSAQRMRLERAGAGLIWCPSSNMNLFGKTAEVADLVKRGCVALGTDSRMSGGRDLLEELCVAGQILALDDRTLELLVTRDSSRLLRLPDRGELRVGARADVLILPADARLAATRRADVRLVLIDGIAVYGDKDYAQMLTPASRWAEVRVDGQPKLLDCRIAARLSGSSAGESGLHLTDAAWRAA
jgi:hypothetical protein